MVSSTSSDLRHFRDFIILPGLANIIEGAEPSRDDQDSGDGQPLLVDREGQPLQAEASDDEAEAEEDVHAELQVRHLYV